MTEVDQPVSISDDPLHPLEVALMSFQHMPEKRAVSLILPEVRSHTKVRLVNMPPQTALNLLTWLESAKETLEVLAKDGQS